MTTYRTNSLILLFLLLPVLLYAQCYKYVDPLIGAEGDGNVFIGPCCPFGMIKPGPDCNKLSNSGYSADMNKPVYGFGQTHVSGTGGGSKYGNISIMPFAGDYESIKQESLRANEKVELGYYGVTLKKWNIKTEITTSPKVAYYRHIFHNTDKKAVKLDCGEFLGETPIPDGREAQQFVSSEVEVVSNNEVRGYSRIRGGWNNGSAYTVYFTAIFNHPFTSFSTWKDNQLAPGQKLQVDTGQKTGAMLFFESLQTDTIEMKVGISFISSSKAKLNISTEIPYWSFEKTLYETQGLWENLLKRIEIDSSTSRNKKPCFTLHCIIPC